MANKGIRIAVIGAGLGGPATASLLQAVGYNVKVYEQSPSFSRLGAGINLSPNVVRILQRIGVGHKLADAGARTARWTSRRWDTGELLLDFPLAEECMQRYGAPYLCVHRGDFHALLIDAVRPGTIEFGKRLADLDWTGKVVKLAFEDGTRTQADIVIGADGVRSRCREILVGLKPPTFTGFVAHRCILPVSLLAGMHLPDYTKWWGGERLFLTYFITADRKEFYIVTGSPQAHWPHETSWVPADMDELKAAFVGFHPEVHQQIAACPAANTTKWAMYDSEPLPVWSRGRVVLLGDACHAMTPYMGQGAAMAIEDGAMLTRCLEAASGDPEHAIQLYEENRKDRTAAVAAESRKNTWLMSDADPDWVWGYDVFKEPIRPLSKGTHRLMA
jgi:6-hydroxynicotinate 3-monooxygenase